MLRRIVKFGVIGGVAVLLLIQLVPYGRDHDNPPVTQAPRWSSARAEQLAVDACYDCHSNETEWPWYTNIAPMSWLTQRDVDAGREAVNYSELDRDQDELKDSAEVIADGEMPPRNYVLLHPDANLSDAERRALIEGFVATFDEVDPED